MSATLKLCFPSDPRFLSPLRAMIGSVAEMIGFGEKEIGMLQLALNEAVTNIIRHSLKNDFDRTIELDLELAERGLEIVLRDDGEPAVEVFDLRPSIPSPDRAGGAGLFLMYECLDKIHYERLSDNRNQLRFAKNHE
jgi:serine/threonine-protein kinase RsbW